METFTIKEYKGYTIRFEISNGQFYSTATDRDTSIGWYDTLKAIEDKIDRLTKAESKIKPINVYLFNGYGSPEYKRGTITSINSESKSAWFVSNKGDRQKLDTHSAVYADNEANAAIANEISEKSASIHQLRQEQALLLRKLTGKIEIGQPIETINP